MSFSVQLTPDFIPVEPGATTPVSVVVINKADEADRFELEIEGVDSEWTAVPVPVFGAEPNETHTERIFFKPSRTSESSAGNYPFTVRVRSLISGEAKTVQAVLEVKVFNHVSMEISPKKGFYSVWRKKNSFAAVVVNLGNSEHTLQMIANDPEDACAYEFETDQVSVAPGQQKEVEFVAMPTHRPLFAGGRLIGFSVTARGVDHPSVVASAQAQLEQRPFLTPTGLILTFIVAVIIGLWYLMKPQPLEIVNFWVSPQSAVKGEAVTVNWRVGQATHVKVTAGADTVLDSSEEVGRVTYTPTTSGRLDFRIVASSDGQQKTQDYPITVKEPETAPEPEIITLMPKPIRLKLGASFELDYTLSPSVTKAVLEPVNTSLDPSLNRLEITPTRTGELEYTLVASNKDGKSTSQSFKITVDDVSDATIIAFSPSNVTVPVSVGKVTLSWQVTGAVRVELSSKPGETQQVDPSASMLIPLTAKTTFTLTAYDSKGRRASQSRVVDLVPDPPPVDPNSPPVGPPTGDKGGATGAPGVGGAATGGGRLF
jgi:hypothetical protein